MKLRPTICIGSRSRSSRRRTSRDRSTACGYTGVPMAAGENNCTSFQFRDMFAAGAVDYAQSRASPRWAASPVPEGGDAGRCPPA